MDRWEIKKDKENTKATIDTDDSSDVSDTHNKQDLIQETKQHNPPPTDNSQQTRNNANGRYALRAKPKRKREAEYEYSS